jgi:hypothetical protein
VARLAAEARVAAVLTSPPRRAGRRRLCATAESNGQNDAQTTSAARNAGSFLIIKRNTLGRARAEQQRTPAKGRRRTPARLAQVWDSFQFSVFGFQLSESAARALIETDSDIPY